MQKPKGGSHPATKWSTSGLAAAQTEGLAHMAKVQVIVTVGGRMQLNNGAEETGRRSISMEGRRNLPHRSGKRETQPGSSYRHYGQRVVETIKPPNRHGLGQRMAHFVTFHEIMTNYESNSRPT